MICLPDLGAATDEVYKRGDPANWIGAVAAAATGGAQHMPGERNYHVFYMLCKADERVRSHGKLEGWETYAGAGAAVRFAATISDPLSVRQCV